MSRIGIALLFGLLSLQAAAACYTVFDKQDRIIYRDTATPVDLSGSIVDAVRARFPGAYLVISGETQNCVPVVPGSPVDTRGIASAASGPAAPTPITRK